MSGSTHGKRAIPTLTEVVHRPAPAALSVSEQDQLVQLVLERVAPDVEAQVRAVLQQQFQDQLSAIWPKLQLEVELLIRQTVARAMADTQR